jgi:PKD domain
MASLAKNRFTQLLGTSFMLLAGATIPAQATVLTGFTTTGSMMAGMQVTASFTDGSSESVIWSAANADSGGVFGNGWSLTESGNSFNQPWTLTNTGLGITSLVIDAIPGNTVFDIYPYGDKLPQTDGSADGWGFETINGQSPTSSSYSDVIDISAGDLFGKLSLYWTEGFTGLMNFRADTDSGSAQNPVQARDPVARDSPPVVDFALPTIDEGQTASTTLFATQPGENALSFFLNGRNLGTDFRRSGVRSVNTDLGFFDDNGEHNYTAWVRDENGRFSRPVTRTLQVLNVAPTLTRFRLGRHVIYQGQSVFGRLFATDPGADSQTFFVNGNQVGVDGQTTGTRSTRTFLGRFTDVGWYSFTGLAQDKDGADSNPLTRYIRVLNVAPTITNVTADLTTQLNDLFDFTASATDPGINDLLTYNWDLNGDGVFDDFTGASGQWSFTDPGSHQIGVQVSDGHGGFDYSYFNVDTTEPPAPPVDPIVTPPPLPAPPGTSCGWF